MKLESRWFLQIASPDIEDLVNVIFNVSTVLEGYLWDLINQVHFCTDGSGAPTVRNL